MTGFLDREITDLTYRDHFGTLKRQIQQLEELINRLLFFIEVHKNNLYEKIDLKEIESIIDRIRMRYPEKKASVHQDIKTDGLYYWQYVIVDELLENSFKFCNKSQLELWMRIHPHFLEVEDNGPGIPSEEKEKIFEPFYQIEKYITYNVPGVGLGLTLVRRLAELEGGEVRVENRKSGGLKVRIMF